MDADAEISALRAHKCTDAQIPPLDVKQMHTNRTSRKGENSARKGQEGGAPKDDATVQQSSKLLNRTEH